MLVAELLNGWTAASAATAAVVAGVFSVLFVFFYRRSKRIAREKYPPMAPVGMWEAIQAISGDDAPWFFIRHGQNLGTSVYQLNIPLFGAAPMAVVVGDHTLARDILTDKASEKPLQLYQGFTEASNGVQSLFGSNGSYWHARRKGMAPAFSHSHVQRMNAIALSKTDEWIRDRLRPLMEEGSPLILVMR